MKNLTMPAHQIRESRVNEVRQTSSGISVVKFDAGTVRGTMLVHDKCSSFQKELDRKDARIRALKAWLCYLAIVMGFILITCGMAILTYLEDIK